MTRLRILNNFSLSSSLHDLLEYPVLLILVCSFVIILVIQHSKQSSIHPILIANHGVVGIVIGIGISNPFNKIIVYSSGRSTG
jgi:heme A synthase